MSTATAILVFLVALAATLGASEILVWGLSRLGLKLGLAAGLLGLLTAFGADAPEIASASSAAFSSARDIGIRAQRVDEVVAGGRLEQALKPDVDRSGGQRSAQPLSHLVKDLLLADDRTLQPGGDTHHMHRRRFTGLEAEPGIDSRNRAHPVELGAVAGAEEKPVRMIGDLLLHQASRPAALLGRAGTRPHGECPKLAGEHQRGFPGPTVAPIHRWFDLGQLPAAATIDTSASTSYYQDY